MNTPTHGLFGLRRQSGGEHWLTTSDLMAGLMMVFLLISVALMHRTQEQASKYLDRQDEIDEALRAEFEHDLMKWDATIKNLTVEFHSPEVLFKAGSAELREKFVRILDDFVPRYLRVLQNFRDVIEEVRIEGHTSSEWPGATKDEAYFNNMRLSQGRTLSVLEHVYGVSGPADRRFVRCTFTAVGLSSSRLVVVHGLNEEDPDASRRVLFRVVTNAEEQIRNIVSQSRDDARATTICK